MKFVEAFEKAWEKLPKEARPTGNENYPKILTFLWTMLAISENKLDDIAFISNNQIVSIPLQKSGKPVKDEQKEKPVKKDPEPGEKESSSKEKTADDKKPKKGRGRKIAAEKEDKINNNDGRTE